MQKDSIEFEKKKKRQKSNLPKRREVGKIKKTERKCYNHFVFMNNEVRKMTFWFLHVPAIISSNF